MRFDGFMRRWCWSILCVGMIALGATLVPFDSGTAEEQQARPAQQEQVVPTASAGADLADRVEVQLPDSLFRLERTTYSVEAALVNSAEEPLEGPLLLVVEGTGVEELAIENADGSLDSGEPFFRFLAGEDEVLEAGEATPARRIEFETEEPLRVAQRRAFELDYRVVREVGKGDAPEDQKQEDERVFPMPDRAEVQRVMKVQDAWTERLLAIEGVQGTATSVDVEGRVVVRVYLERAGIRHDVPETVDGVPVLTQVTGPIRIRQRLTESKASGRDASISSIPDPRQRFPRPIPIGVSVGHPDVTAGTLGCRVRKSDGTLFALSNNHVIANSNNADVGDPILHPGVFDGGTAPGDIIGTLSEFVEIDLFDFFDGFDGQTNELDAAIAQVTAANVGNATPQGAYGLPKTEVAEAELGMVVQKMGRTTSLSTGIVTGVNATVDVGFAFPLAARFVKQIEITRVRVEEDPDGLSGPFGLGGDSGSLVVTVSEREPVGLLFAGSAGGQFIFANRIQAVLEAFDVEIDGEEVKVAPGPRPRSPGSRKDRDLRREDRRNR